MRRFKIGDRATYHKLPHMLKHERDMYLGRIGIVTEVENDSVLDDGTIGEVIRISYTTGKILNIKSPAKYAMHKG